MRSGTVLLTSTVSEVENHVKIYQDLYGLFMKTTHCIAACPRSRDKLVQECAKRSHNKNFYRSTGDIQKSQTNNRFEQS